MMIYLLKTKLSFPFLQFAAKDKIKNDTILRKKKKIEKLMCISHFFLSILTSALGTDPLNTYCNFNFKHKTSHKISLMGLFSCLQSGTQICFQAHAFSEKENSRPSIKPIFPLVWLRQLVLDGCSGKTIYRVISNIIQIVGLILLVFWSFMNITI